MSILLVQQQSPVLMLINLYQILKYQSLKKNISSKKNHGKYSYVLCRWEFKAAKITFDEANKLAHSCHIELADYWQTKSFIKKDKEFVQILGPQDRDLDDIKDSGELIDALHHAIKLLEKGNKAEMQKLLNESGYAKSDSFFRVAQAIAETLPNEAKEKKLLEGFLNLYDKISEGFKPEEKYKTLFD